MLLQETISYRQLYQLFGYKKELDLEEIFSSLLFSISPIGYDDLEKMPPSVIASDGLSMSNEAAIYLFPNLCKAKDVLPAYLSVKYTYRDMLGIETKLCTICRKKKELSSIPWYCLRKKYSLWREISKYFGLRLDIKMVFAYFEYRAKNSGIMLTELHMKFKEYAKNYPSNIL